VDFARGRFLVGALLLAGSAAGLRWLASLWRADDPPELSPPTRLIALAAVVAVGAFFRFYRMVPPGIWGDDAINGLLAFDVLDGKITSPFQLVQHSKNRLHALTTFAIAASFWAFGPSLETLRLSGVILSWLCVPLLYGTFAPLFGARAALCAALFFATSAVQISHGKIFLQVVTGEFLHLLALCLLVRGCTGPRRWLIVLSGIPLALSLCTYHPYKLGPLIAAVLVAAVLSRGGAALGGSQPASPRPAALPGRLGWWIAAGVVVFLASAVPGLLAYVGDPNALTGRLQNTSSLGVARAAGSLWPLWDSLWRTLLIFHYEQGPRNTHWLGIATDPALDFIVAFLACHGFLQSLLRWREPRHLLLLLWFAVGLLPGILSSEAPRVYRVLLATPPVYVWAALPVERLLALAEVRRSRLAGALAGLVLVAVPLVDFDYYFHGVYTHPGYHSTQASRMVDMARALRDRGPGWTGYLLAANYDANHETFRFLARLWNLQMRDVVSLSDVMPLRHDGNALLLFDPATMPLVPAVQAFYPGATPSVQLRPRRRKPWLEALLAGADTGAPEPQAAFLPLSQTALGSGNGVTAFLLAADGTPIATQIWPSLSFREPPRADPTQAPAARAVLAAAFYAPLDGTYTFALDGAPAASVWLDQRLILSSDRRQATVELEQGLHGIRAAIDVAAGSTFDVRWQLPDEPPADIPPTLLYRERQLGGWLAEYRNDTRRLRRLEPMPWYWLYPRTFEGRYDVRWRGRLRVPAGGRYFDVRANGRPTVRIDGQDYDSNRLLAEGEHQVELTLEGVQGSQVLELTWRDSGKRAARVPMDAFLPPPEYGSGAGGSGP
jgi:hypothetical protein